MWARGPCPRESDFIAGEPNTWRTTRKRPNAGQAARAREQHGPERAQRSWGWDKPQGRVKRRCRRVESVSVRGQGDSPGGPVVRALCFHCRAQVQSLARELRSHKPHGAAKKRKERKREAAHR